MAMGMVKETEMETAMAGALRTVKEKAAEKVTVTEPDAEQEADQERRTGLGKGTVTVTWNKGKKMKTKDPQRYLYAVTFTEGNLPFKWASTIEVATDFVINKPEDLIGYIRKQEKIHFAIEIHIWNVVMSKVSPPQVEWTWKEKEKDYEVYRELV